VSFSLLIFLFHYVDPRFQFPSFFIIYFQFINFCNL
jgi:hypothetical protein